MEIPGPTAGIFRVPPTTTATVNGQWQPGQLLQATVSGSEPGKILLSVGNRQLIAETSLALQKGQQLTLLVRSLGSQPALQITSLPTEAALTTAVRLLLPRQGNPAPLLASLGQLARTTGTAVPAEVTEASRSLLRKLPDSVSVSSARGLKQALLESGAFLENKLLRATEQSSSSISFNTDLKANLLRLVQVVRNWPGTAGTAAAAQQHTATGNSAAAGQPPPTIGKAQDQPSATQEQVRRLVRAGINPAPSDRSPVTTSEANRTPKPPDLGTGTARSPQTATMAATATTARTPPPFRGTIPVPQPPVPSTLDLLNADNLRADLLRQIEASLSRLQLQQLASAPREGERGLVEWLLDLPVRRGEDVDIWSMRWYREAEAHTPGTPDTTGWCVQLAFDLPGLGPIQALVQLHGEQVTTRFWAQQAHTPSLVQAHLGELREALQAAGLQVGELDCRAGNMPTAETKTENLFIREKA